MAQGAFTMALIPKFRGSLLAVTLTLAAAMALIVSGASPARADRCDDLAGQLKGQIDGLKVGITAGRVIYLSHPLAKELSLGCASRKFSNELYAKANGRKPKPEFLDFVAGLKVHVADGHFSRRRCLDTLPPPRHELHANQDRRRDCDFARYRPVRRRLRAGKSRQF